MTHEYTDTHETISQQFIDYIHSHSDPATEQSPRDVVRRGRWSIHVSLPLLRDTIEEVTYGVNKVEGDDGFTGELSYDVGVLLRNGLSGLFSYEPDNVMTPYYYLGIDDDAETIQENDIANLLSEIEAYETSGQMVKIEP